nr:reverse transcriptase domain-containing protein [Tanacetum cinerariifolium]
MVTKLRNEITNFCQRLDESLFEAWELYKLSIDHCPNHNMLPVTQIDTFYNGLTLRHRDTINAAAGGTFKKRRPEECYDLIENMTAHHNDWDTSVQRRPTIPTTYSPPKVVERKTGVTKDTVPPTNNGSTKDVQPSVVQVETPIPNSEPVVDPVVAPEKLFKIFKDLDFNISFVDALILMPKFGPTTKSLSTNKEKLYELARTPLNEHCLVVLLKKLPKKLGDPDKFLIPCNFLGMDEGLALADLDASINLMPLFVWNKLSLPKLSPMCMTIELAERSISHPVRVAEDVFVKVGTFYFQADFVVVEFDADPRVPLILGRSFLKTGRALIDVYEGELTLPCEEYSQEVLGFFMSGNPTPSMEPIVSTSAPTLTPFGDIDFLFEETDAFLAIDDEPISSKMDESYYDSEGDILLLEEFLNDDPSSPPLLP